MFVPAATLVTWPASKPFDIMDSPGDTGWRATIGITTRRG